MDNLSEKLFWDQLIQLIEAKSVVPIVGRDLLIVRNKDRDIHLYELVARRLAEYIEVSDKNIKDNDEINTIVCRFIEKGQRIEDIYSILKIVMPNDAEISIPESIKKLAEIDSFKLFVTTTFDNLLERAINKARFKGKCMTKTFSYSPNFYDDLSVPIEDIETPTIYHLFGKLSAIPEYALTQEDTLEFLYSLQSESRIPKLLFDALNRTNLLFLGCSFGDWLSRFFLRTAKRQRFFETRGSTDYIADENINEDKNLVIFLEHFSKRTKIYKKGGAHEFINELHRRWLDRRKLIEPKNDKKIDFSSDIGFVKSGAIFLSYANEDQQSVFRIKNSLEAEGIDVFYDKEKLYAGDDYELKIKHNISESSLFIPVISKNCLTPRSRFFRIEWNHALNEARKLPPTAHFILPVVIDETSPNELSIEEKIRKLHWEKMHDGIMTSGFIDLVKKLYRNYQKIMAGSV